MAALPALTAVNKSFFLERETSVVDDATSRQPTTAFR
jgi:hypothetical protein